MSIIRPFRALRKGHILQLRMTTANPLNDDDCLKTNPWRQWLGPARAAGCHWTKRRGELSALSLQPCFVVMLFGANPPVNGFCLSIHCNQLLLQITTGCLLLDTCPLRDL